METSQFLSKINQIRDKNRRRTDTNDKISVLHNYKVHYDHVSRKVMIEAKLDAKCLEKGKFVTEYSLYMVALEGVTPGDRAVQLIDKRLGGPGDYFNVVPLNAEVSLIFLSV